MGVILIVVFIVLAKKAWDWWVVKTTKPDFTGKTVWITGASSGIGEQLAKDFSKLGASIIITSRKIADLQRVQKECTNPSKVRVVPLDMSDQKEMMAQTQKVISELEAQNIKLDILIENAGVSMRSLFKDTDLETHTYLTNLNYNGPVAHVKAILPHLINNKSGQIVLMNSIAGLLAPGMRTSYVGSKHALRGFFDSLRAEVAEYNINITSIYPGYVATDVSKNALSGKQGESFGKVDTNIQNGEDVSSFCKKAIVAICRKQNDAVITKSLVHDMGVYLRNITFDTVHKLTLKNLKSQQEALKKAQ